MRRWLAALLALAMLVVPTAAQATSVDFSVILSTQQYQDSHHWEFRVDNSSTITPGDTFSYVVGEEYGIIPLKAGGTDWIGYGSITNWSGTSQFVATSYTTHFTCISPFQKAFNNMGCIGSPELFGLGSSKLVNYQLDFYPAQAPNFVDEWEIWAEDLMEVYHPIAVLLDMNGTYQNPHVAGAMVYPGPTINYPDIELYFTHPHVWQGGVGWQEWPSASSSFTYSSYLDSAMCPISKAILRFPDHRSWMITRSMISTATVTVYCTDPHFFP